MEKNGKQIFINVITHQSPFLCLFVLSEHERWRVGVSLSKANNLKKKNEDMQDSSEIPDTHINTNIARIRRWLMKTRLKDIGGRSGRERKRGVVGERG